MVKTKPKKLLPRVQWVTYKTTLTTRGLKVKTIPVEPKHSASIPPSPTKAEAFSEFTDTRMDFEPLGSPIPLPHKGKSYVSPLRFRRPDLILVIFRAKMTTCVSGSHEETTTWTCFSMLKLHRRNYPAPSVEVSMHNGGAWSALDAQLNALNAASHNMSSTPFIGLKGGQGASSSLPHCMRQESPSNLGIEA
jgi:hypothetical protein